MFLLGFRAACGWLQMGCRVSLEGQGLLYPLIAHLPLHPVHDQTACVDLLLVKVGGTQIQLSSLIQGDVTVCCKCLIV